MIKIGILNYTINSNKVHLRNILENLNCKVEYVNTFKDIKKYELIFNPGVGSFSNCINSFKKKDFDKAIQDLNPNKRYLGICLGFQILFETGNENNIKTSGLKIIKGHVKKIVGKNPKIGFFKTNIKKDYLFKDIQNFPEFYYLHGYGVKSDKDDSEFSIIKYSNIYYKSCVRYKNYTGVQFHPEASGKSGLNFLRNFIYE